jgi:hypothetical protein
MCILSKVDVSFKDSLKTHKALLYVQGILHHVHTLISLFPNNQNAQATKVGRSSKSWSKCGENFNVADL